MNNSYKNSLQNGINGISITDDLAIAFDISNTEQEAAVSVLPSIVGMVGGKKNAQYFLPEMLSIKKEVALPTSTASVQGVEDLKSKAQITFRQIEAYYQKSPNDFAQKYSLYHALFAYGSRVGYGQQAAEGVSLFDTNRVLGAIIACQSVSDEPKYLLLKGAFSGIQNFLYSNIETQEVGDAANLAKKLRGRSFFVEIATGFIAEQLVEICGVEMANIIFTGGGHFNLLLPDTEKVKNTIRDFINTTNNSFLENVGLRLSIVYAIEECGADIFSDFSPKYTAVNDKLENVKQKKYQNTLKDVFEVKPRSYKFKDDFNLGGTMPYADYLIEITTYEEKGLPSKLKENCVISTFGFLHKYFLVFKEKKDLLKIRDYLSEYSGYIKSAKIIALNKPSIVTNITAFEPLDFPIAFGFKFMGNNTPMISRKEKQDNGKIKSITQVATFEKISESGKNGEKLTYKQLGVMRMDVDDLGAIFAFGLEDENEKTSFQRMASLSREFSIFFSGYFNELAKRHNIYITYSGGDDAFVIGSWQNTMEFARDLKQEFDKFTCHNENVLFSAGIFMCDEHYPVVRMAKDAALLEKESKNYALENGNIGKNAITLFSHTLTWDRYIAKLDFVKKLESVVESDTDKNTGKGKHKLRRSLLQRLLNIIQSNKDDDYMFYKNLSYFYNLIARHGFTRKNLEGKFQGKLVGEVLNSILLDFNNKNDFKDYTIPIHYILYQTRKTKK